jgi:hypothetical protein
MNENKSRTSLYIAGGIAGVLVLCLLFYFVASNGVTNDGNKKQQSLIALYNETTNHLSDCLVKTKQSVGGATANAGVVEKIVTNAVKGQYDNRSATGHPTGELNNSFLLQAVRQAYPDTTQVSKVYQDVLIVINGCRTDFRDSQSHLQKAVTTFNGWRTGSWTVRTFGGGNYPNDDLEITVSGKPVTGKAALAQMRNLVVVSAAQTGRDTGKIDNSDPFNTGG